MTDIQSVCLSMTVFGGCEVEETDTASNLALPDRVNIDNVGELALDVILASLHRQGQLILLSQVHPHVWSRSHH